MKKDGMNLSSDALARDQKPQTRRFNNWRHNFGHYPVFAAVPAVCLSNVPGTLSEPPRNQPATVTEQGARPGDKLNMSVNNLALLKRQSRFRLSHQAVTQNFQTALGGSDDCPGRAIPGRTYTAASPFIDSGNTTGANNTVNKVYYYYYYSYDAAGPDNVYSFTLTSTGANPQIKVSTTSSTYKPLVYLLPDPPNAGCPAGTGNTLNYVWAVSEAPSGGNVTFDLRYLPLNVPIHLFIDSVKNDATGSGPYTLQIQDVTIAGPPPAPNPIDSSDFFVRQQYLDFLSREPEQDGMNAWLQVLNNCAAGDQLCEHEQRLTTSAALFGSPEFELKGYFAFRFYRIAFARLPDFSEISTDMQSVSGQTQAEVYSRKASFANGFVQRPEFTALYNSLSNADYVAALMGRYSLTSISAPDPTQPDGNSKVTLTQTELVNSLNGGTLTRAQVLRAIVESYEVFQYEFNRAFVAMQYFGYLRRNPDPAGYIAWLDYLTFHPEESREMVRGFVDSIEYRNRFGQP